MHVPRLLLLAGEYEVTAALADETEVVGTPDRERITVEPGDAAEAHGVISLGAEWDVSPTRSGV